MSTTTDTFDVITFVLSFAAAAAVVSATMVCGALAVYALARSLARRESAERTFDERTIKDGFLLWFISWWSFVSDAYRGGVAASSALGQQIIAAPLTTLVTLAMLAAAVFVRTFQSTGTPLLSDAYVCTVNPVNFIILAVGDLLRLIGATLQPLWNGLALRIPNVAVIGFGLDLLGVGPLIVAVTAFNLLQAAAFFALALVNWLGSGALLTTQPNFLPFATATGNTIAVGQILFTQICQSVFTLFVAPFFASFGRVDVPSLNTSSTGTLRRFRAAAMSLAAASRDVPLVDHRAEGLPWTGVDVAELPVMTAARSFLGDAVLVEPLVSDSTLRTTNFPELLASFANAPLMLLQDVFSPLINAARALGEDTIVEREEVFMGARPSFNNSLGSFINISIETGRFVDVIVGNYYEFIVGSVSDTLGFPNLVAAPLDDQVLPFPYGPARAPPGFGVVVGYVFSTQIVVAKVLFNIVFQIDRVVSTYDGQLILRWDEVYDHVNATTTAACAPFEWSADFLRALGGDIARVQPPCPASTAALCAQPECSSDADCAANELCSGIQQRCYVPTCVLAADGTVCSGDVNVSGVTNVVCAIGQCMGGECELDVDPLEAFACECTCDYVQVDSCVALIEFVNTTGVGAQDACALDVIADLIDLACCVVKSLVRFGTRIVKNVAEILVGTLYTVVATLVDPFNSKCSGEIAPADEFFCALPRTPQSSFVLSSAFRFAQFYWGDRGVGTCNLSLCARPECTSASQCSSDEFCDENFGRCFSQCNDISDVNQVCAVNAGVGAPGECALGRCNDTPFGGVVCQLTDPDGDIFGLFPCDCSCAASTTNEFRVTGDQLVAAVNCIGDAFIAAIGPPGKGIATFVSTIGRSIEEVLLLLIDLFAHVDQIFVGVADISTTPLYAALRGFADSLRDFSVAYTLKGVNTTEHPHKPTLKFGDCAGDLPEQAFTLFEGVARAVIDSLASLYNSIARGSAIDLVRSIDILNTNLELAITALQNIWEDTMCVVFQAIPDNASCPANAAAGIRTSFVDVADLVGTFFTETLRALIRSVVRGLDLAAAVISGQPADIADKTALWFIVVIEWIITLIAEVIRTAGTFFGCFVSAAFESIFDKIAAGLLELIPIIEEFIGDLTQGVFLAIGAIIGFFSGSFDELFTFLEFILTRIFSAVINLFGSAFVCKINELICFFLPGGISGLEYCWDSTSESAKDFVRFTGETVPVLPGTGCTLGLAWLCGAIRDITCFFSSLPPGPFCCACDEDDDDVPCTPPLSRRRKRSSLWSTGDVFPELARHADRPARYAASNMCIGVLAPYVDAEWPPTRALAYSGEEASITLEVCSFMFRDVAARRMAGERSAPLPRAYDPAGVAGYAMYLLSDVFARVENLNSLDDMHAEHSAVEKREFHQSTGSVGAQIAFTLVDTFGITRPLRARGSHLAALGRIAAQSEVRHRRLMDEAVIRRQRWGGDASGAVLGTFEDDMIALDWDNVELWSRVEAGRDAIASTVKRAVPSVHALEYAFRVLAHPRSTAAAYYRARAHRVVGRPLERTYRRHRDPAEPSRLRVGQRPPVYERAYRRLAQRSELLLRGAVARYGAEGLEHVSLDERGTAHLEALTAPGAETVVSIFSPFVCPPPQVICIECSWLDRLLWAIQDTAVDLYNYYRGAYVSESVAQTAEVAASLALYAETGRYNNDTFVSEPRTIPFIVDSLHNVTFFWQFDYTKFFADLNPASSAANQDVLFPPNSPLVDTYIPAQEEAVAGRSRGSTNLALVDLADRLSFTGNLGEQVVFLGENATGLSIQTIISDVFVFENFVEQYVACNYSFGHYCKRDPVTGERLLGIGLLSALVNAFIVLAIIAILAASFVYCVQCWAFLYYLGLVAIPLTLAFAYGVSPLCYTPGVVAAGYVALPSLFTGVLRWPGLPACFFDDVFNLYWQLLPPYLPQFSELIRPGDLRANNFNSRCVVGTRQAPDVIDCTLESSMVDGSDSFFYFLEQLIPGINERIASADLGTVVPWIQEAAAAHTAARNAAEPEAFACATWGLLDIVAFAFVLGIIAALLAVAVVIVYTVLWFLTLALFSSVFFVWEIFVQVENGYIHSFTHNENVSSRDAGITTRAPRTLVPSTEAFFDSGDV